jgi:hypothetical protein
LKRGDLFYLASYVPLMSTRAVTVLSSLLEPNAEILPVECAERDLALINVTRTIDALDLQRSIVEVFPHSGLLARINVPVFIPDRVVGIDIFRVTRIRHGDLYVSERFVSTCELANLRGLQFAEVWQSSPS